jgi:hypothetical protein
MVAALIASEELSAVSFTDGIARTRPSASTTLASSRKSSQSNPSGANPIRSLVPSRTDFPSNRPIATITNATLA